MSSNKDNYVEFSSRDDIIPVDNWDSVLEEGIQDVKASSIFMGAQLTWFGVQRYCITKLTHKFVT